MIVEAICSSCGLSPTTAVIYCGKNNVTIFAEKIVFAKSKNAHARIGRDKNIASGLRVFSIWTSKITMINAVYLCFVLSFLLATRSRGSRACVRYSSGASFPFRGADRPPAELRFHFEAPIDRQRSFVF